MRINKTIDVDLRERNIFFTSDSHFDHARVIEFCNRPFSNVRDMNHQLIQNWNRVVGPDDLVIVGGDFCFGGAASWMYLLNTLTGIKYLTYGNHDRVSNNLWQRADNLLNFNIKEEDGQEQRLTVCHYPMLSWYQSHRGAWQLFGHVHGKLSSKDLADDGWSLKGKLSPRQLDIGVDVHNYTPISYNEVKTIITRQINRYKKSST